MHTAHATANGDIVFRPATAANDRGPGSSDQVVYTPSELATLVNAPPVGEECIVTHDERDALVSIRTVDVSINLEAISSPRLPRYSLPTEESEAPDNGRSLVCRPKGVDESEFLQAIELTVEIYPVQLDSGGTVAESQPDEILTVDIKGQEQSHVLFTNPTPAARTEMDGRFDILEPRS